MTQDCGEVRGQEDNPAHTVWGASPVSVTRLVSQEPASVALSLLYLFFQLQKDVPGLRSGRHEVIQVPGTISPRLKLKQERV